MTTASGSTYLIGGLSRISSGLVVVRTANHARVSGLYLVNYCPTHRSEPAKVQVGQPICLGRQGTQPDAQAVHTTAVTSIYAIEGARAVMTDQGPQFTLPQGHELAPLTKNILAH